MRGRWRYGENTWLSPKLSTVVKEGLGVNSVTDQTSPCPGPTSPVPCGLIPPSTPSSAALSTASPHARLRAQPPSKT